MYSVEYTSLFPSFSFSFFFNSSQAFYLIIWLRCVCVATSLLACSRRVLFWGTKKSETSDRGLFPSPTSILSLFSLVALFFLSLFFSSTFFFLRLFFFLFFFIFFFFFFFARCGLCFLLVSIFPIWFCWYCYSGYLFFSPSESPLSSFFFPLSFTCTLILNLFSTGREKKRERERTGFDTTFSFSAYTFNCFLVSLSIFFSFFFFSFLI
jgi:hypothetical protein